MMGFGSITLWQLLGVSVIVVIYLVVRKGRAKEKKSISTSTSSEQQSNANPQVSVGKVIIYAVVTWLIVSALAKAYVELVMAPKYPGYSMYEAQSVIWSWACALMGIFLALRLKRGVELLWGGVFFLVCLVPPGILSIGRELGGLISIVIGIGYFSWSYVRLAKYRFIVNAYTAPSVESAQILPSEKHTSINKGAGMRHPIVLIIVAAAVILGLYYIMSPYQNCMRGGELTTFGCQKFSSW